MSRATEKQEGVKNMFKEHLNVLSGCCLGEHQSGLQFNEEAYWFSFHKKIEMILYRNQGGKNNRENKVEFVGSCSKLKVTGEQVLSKYGISISTTVSPKFIECLPCAKFMSPFTLSSPVR